MVTYLCTKNQEKLISQVFLLVFFVFTKIVQELNQVKYLCKNEHMVSHIYLHNFSSNYIWM